MNAITLSTHGLGKDYGERTALADLSFTAHAGEIIGLLGPNGAGKTSAIRVLTTILPPSRGTFEVDGIPHTRPREIRARVGVLPESSGYPLRQTGRQFLRYYARLYGQPADAAQARTASLLDEVGLSERGDSPIGSYSRGMRQRLSIARAIINDPSVVFLDEPTLGLDPFGQRQVLELVRKIAIERRATVVLSTHLLNEVEETCSRVLMLHRGRVVAEGSVADVTRRAAAPRTARLRVPEEAFERAQATLAAAPGVTAVEPAAGLRGSLLITLADGSAAREIDTRPALAALAAADIALLAFELQGARLSDAFLAVAGES